MHDRPRVSGGAGREDALKLVNVYSGYHTLGPLYDLLKERTPEQSISHKAMPTWEGHCEFVASRPYLFWYLIEDRNDYLGACYLSRQREIGISIFKDFRGCGYGREAVELLMSTHPGKFLANVAPTNPVSAHMFARLGFNLIQHTYAK
jgi:RimJ/RimL family protein N-acetyltransferase